MADIKLRIEVNPDGASATIESIKNMVGSSYTNANVSNSSFKAGTDGLFVITVAANKRGREMLSWGENGVLKFNPSGQLSSDGVAAGSLISETAPDEFVWGVVPNTKKYSVKLTLTGSSTLQKIIVYGDPTANQFPTKAILDGDTTICSDDYQWAIDFGKASGTHTIEFTEWNRVGYNACLTRIIVFPQYIDLDKGWLNNLESLSQSTSDPSSIQYGVLANSGSANITDLDGEIADYIKDGIMTNSNVDTEIIINGNIIAKHFTSDTEYDNNSKTLKLEQTNDLSNLREMKFDGFGLTDPISAYNLLKEVLNTINYDINNIASGDAKDKLKQITIKYPYLEADTYYNTIQKFCDMAQLQMFEDNNGTVKIVNGRPTATIFEVNDAIKIPKNMMTAPLSQSIILKNKIKTISYTNRTYSYEPKKVGTGNFTYYKQTPITQLYNNAGDDTKTFMYSGMLKDYKYVGTNQSGDETDSTAILGLYDMDTSTGHVSGKGTINRIRFEKNDISKLDWCDTYISHISSNYYPRYESHPSEQTATYLQYRNENFSYPKITYNFPFVFVDNEESALNNLLSDDHKKISGWAYQIIIDRNYITIYYARQITQTNIPDQYFIGDIDDIVLSDTEDVYINALSIIDDTIINEASKDYTLPTNELIATNNTIGDKTIIEILKNNLLSDYRDGVSNANIDIFCGDMFGAMNKKIKNWQNGEIINVRDVVYFDNDVYANNDQRYWRVTGRKFIYDGSPKLSLELQEIKTIYRLFEYHDEKDVTADGEYIFEYNLADYNIKDNAIEVSIGSGGSEAAHMFTDIDNIDQLYTITSSYGNIDITINNERCKITTQNAVGSYLVLQFKYWAEQEK